MLNTIIIDDDDNYYYYNSFPYDYGTFQKQKGIVELEYWVQITHLQLPCHETIGKLLDFSEYLFLLNRN